MCPSISSAVNADADADVENRRLVPVPSPLKTLITLELSSLRPLPTSCCIYKVPSQLRVLNEKALTPQVVSIGPIHHGRSDLKAMEEYKLRYLQHFLRATRVDLQEFIDIVEDKENSIRHCYADFIPFSSQDFVKLILLDTVFMIEVLLKISYKSYFADKVDEIYHHHLQSVDSLLIEDLLMLENQIPFFIIEEIYELAQINGFVFFDQPCSSRGVKLSSIKEICRLFFRLACSNRGDSETIEELDQDVYKTDFQHILDLVRKYFIPLDLEFLRPGIGPLKIFKIPTITELHQAGVRLKVGSGKKLFDIKLNGRILEIPKIFIWNQSEVLNVNMVSYEQCHYPSNRDLLLSHYFFLLKRLVKTPHDAELLIKHGVVHSSNNPKTMLKLLQHQCNGITINTKEFYFTSLCENLDQYCKRSWHLWRENLKQTYFKTPWTTLSLIAAILILILTFIQTVCSILSLGSY